MKKKPVVLMDANLLCWMAGECGSANPKKFDLDQERKSFDELLTLRSKGTIEIAVSERHVEDFKKANTSRPELRKRIGEHFDRRIGMKCNIVMAGSELDQNEEAVFQLITNGKELQDDPELYLLSHFTDPSITHVATCDSGLPAKFDTYNNIVNKHKKMKVYRDFRRRQSKVTCGLPSQILAELVRAGWTPPPGTIKDVK